MPRGATSVAVLSSPRAPIAAGRKPKILDICGDDFGISTGRAIAWPDELPVATSLLAIVRTSDRNSQRLYNRSVARGLGGIAKIMLMNNVSALLGRSRACNRTAPAMLGEGKRP